MNELMGGLFDGWMNGNIFIHGCIGDYLDGLMVCLIQR